MLQRLTANLVDNALKFSPDGGAIVSRWRARAANSSLRVQDEGPGIDKDFAAVAFERFQPRRPTASRRTVSASPRHRHAIAQRHGFSVVIEPASKGASILVSGPHSVSTAIP